MIHKLFTCFVALFIYSYLAMAQEWSKEDSIWLQNVLEGKEVLKLNEKAKKAIEDGNLIPSLMRKNENRYFDIIIDFNNLGRPDPVRKIDLYAMPPAVFSLYIRTMAETDTSTFSTYKFTLSDEEKAQIKIPNPIFSSMITPLNTDPLHVYGGGNLINGFNFLINLIFKNQQEQKEKKPMTETERKQVIQEINSFRKKSQGDEF